MDFDFLDSDQGNFRRNLTKDLLDDFMIGEEEEEEDQDGSRSNSSTRFFFSETFLTELKTELLLYWLWPMQYGTAFDRSLTLTSTRHACSWFPTVLSNFEGH